METRMWGQRHTLASTYWFYSRSGDSLFLSLSHSHSFPSSSPASTRLPPLLFGQNQPRRSTYASTSPPRHIPWSEFFLFSVHLSLYHTLLPSTGVLCLFQRLFSILCSILATRATLSTASSPTLCSPILRSFLRGSFELYSLSDIVTNVCPIHSAFSSRATLRRWETSLGLREDPLDRGKIPEEKHIRARVVSSKWST